MGSMSTASPCGLRCHVAEYREIIAGSPLRCPGFPVETRGFDDLHAALSTESRKRGRR
jgi:hypothetical protein